MEKRCEVEVADDDVDQGTREGVLCAYRVWCVWRGMGRCTTRVLYRTQRLIER